jgi:hypothetical protein
MSETFRRYWKLWVPALVLVVVNLAILVTYEVAFASDVDQLRDEVAAERSRVELLSAQRTELAELVLGARRSRAGIEHLYRSNFGTERERFTDWIREVKELAEQSGLAPSSISYPREELVTYGLLKRSFDFPISGSYSSLRQFINLLELTESFVVLEGVTMNESEPELRISLSLSTLFATGDEEGDGT